MLQSVGRQGKNVLLLRAVGDGSWVRLLDATPRFVHGCCRVVVCYKCLVGEMLGASQHIKLALGSNIIQGEKEQEGEKRLHTTSDLPLIRKLSLHF